MVPLSRRPPSPTWWTLLHNHRAGIAAVDLFVVPTAFFKLLYGLVILGHERRQLLGFAVTAHPTARMDRLSSDRSFPLARFRVICSAIVTGALPLPTRAGYVRWASAISRGGTLTLAKRPRRALDRINQTGMHRPHHRVRRGSSAPRPESLCHILQSGSHASRALGKDAPESRQVQAIGAVVALPPVLGGLHNHYLRV